MAACCNLPGCGWVTGESVREIALHLAAWHVYEQHPGTWREVIGDRPPLDPDPRRPEVRMVLEALAGGS